MPNEQTDRIEDHVGLTQTDAFEQVTTDESVTTKHLFADGGDGKEEEAVLNSHHAGASSDAPASSGIPSAKRQHGVNDITADQDHTPMANRQLSAQEETKP